MLVDEATARGIELGRVTLAFRKWVRPTIKVGGTLQTGYGVIGFHGITIVEPGAITNADARAAGYLDRAVLIDALARFEAGKIHRIEVHWVGADPRVALREKATFEAEELATILAKLDRLDKSAARGPWTRATLELIANLPETRAATLANERGLATEPFKIDVRKLKNLGLTESLEIGYRLSARGRALLEHLRARRQ